jgi:cysteine synthase A
MRTSRRRHLSCPFGDRQKIRTSGADPRYFLTRQFSNPDNTLAHRNGTAREIAAQLPKVRNFVVVSGVGTGGTLMGLCAGLRDAGRSVAAVLARPVSLGGTLGAECCSFSARIPGVTDRISTLFQESEFAALETIEISDEDALATTRTLIQRGYPVGPSSGLNFHAAELVAARRGGAADTTVLTVFPDRMERYFTTELMRSYATAPA